MSDNFQNNVLARLPLLVLYIVLKSSYSPLGEAKMCDESQKTKVIRQESFGPIVDYIKYR